MLYQEITQCRSCNSTRLESVLDLGNLFISDFILPGAQEDKAPLELLCCQDCSLVQLRHTVNRDRLYRDYYYRSSTNESMVAALQDVVEDAWKRVHIETHDAVIDIGANDGTLLDNYPRKVFTCGFEPSALSSVALDKGHFVMPVYFPPPNNLPVCPGKAKIITSIACFYDIDDPNSFVAAIKDWLHKDGIWVCQFQDFDSMIAATAFDNICHEHLTYWTTRSFRHLLARHGLHVIDQSHNHTNGGSTRYIITHGADLCNSVPAITATESAHRLSVFAHNVERLKHETLGVLECLRQNNKTVLGVAASTKANTLLQYYGVDTTLLPAIVDRNPDKHGRITVGTHIPIVSESEIEQLSPDYLFALAWHFFPSFQQRYSSYQGQWIIPLPTLRFGGITCQPITGELSASI